MWHEALPDRSCIRGVEMTAVDRARRTDLGGIKEVALHLAGDTCMGPILKPGQRRLGSSTSSEEAERPQRRATQSIDLGRADQDGLVRGVPTQGKEQQRIAGSGIARKHEFPHTIPSLWQVKQDSRPQSDVA